jgi:putative NIF3 family GTP cyclohydrolase 1 type 2
MWARYWGACRRWWCPPTIARWRAWPGARAVRKATFEAAIAAGADAFVTGEISEPQAHLAREMGVAYIAAGHHATERYGAPAVAAHVAAQWGLEHVFIDIDNPA